MALSMATDGREAVSAGSLEHRVLAAAGRCIARWGLAKTTLDDVAREAGCSRATVYRAVPGGKDGLVAALVRTEVDRFLAGLAARLDGAADLEDLLVAGVTEAARRLAAHDALQFLVANEPDVVLPHVAFARCDAVFDRVAAVAVPRLRRFLDAERAAEASEWVTRIVLSYLLSPTPGVDLRDDGDARRLVRTFVLPGLTTAPAAPDDGDDGGPHLDLSDRPATANRS